VHSLTIRVKVVLRNTGVEMLDIAANVLRLQASVILAEGLRLVVRVDCRKCDAGGNGGTALEIRMRIRQAVPKYCKYTLADWAGGLPLY